MKAYLGPAIEIADVELWDPAAGGCSPSAAAFEEADRRALDDYKRISPLQDERRIGALAAFDDGLRYPVAER